MTSATTAEKNNVLMQLLKMILQPGNHEFRLMHVELVKSDGIGSWLYDRMRHAYIQDVPLHDPPGPHTATLLNYNVINSATDGVDYVIGFLPSWFKEGYFINTIRVEGKDQDMVIGREKVLYTPAVIKNIDEVREFCKKHKIEIK